MFGLHAVCVATTADGSPSVISVVISQIQKGAVCTQVGCCGGEDGMTKSEEVAQKQHQVQKHDCCGRAGDSGCVCAPGCECVRHKARANPPQSRM